MDFIMDKFYEDTYDKVSNYLKATNLASCKNCTAVITNEVIELWNEQGPIYVDIQEVEQFKEITSEDKTSSRLEETSGKYGS